MANSKISLADRGVEPVIDSASIAPRSQDDIEMVAAQTTETTTARKLDDPFLVTFEEAFDAENPK